MAAGTFLSITHPSQERPATAPTCTTFFVSNSEQLGPSTLKIVTCFLFSIHIETASTTKTKRERSLTVLTATNTTPEPAQSLWHRDGYRLVWLASCARLSSNLIHPVLSSLLLDALPRRLPFVVLVLNVLLDRSLAGGTLVLTVATSRVSPCVEALAVGVVERTLALGEFLTELSIVRLPIAALLVDALIRLAADAVLRGSCPVRRCHEAGRREAADVDPSCSLAAATKGPSRRTRSRETVMVAHCA
eukprot:4355981-Pleurochrysis_carterae.AAC.5